MKEYSLGSVNDNGLDYSNLGSIVREADSENEEESENEREELDDLDEQEEEEDEVHNLSSDNLKRLQEVEEQFNPRQGSIVIDEDGDKFLEAKDGSADDEEKKSQVNLSQFEEGNQSQQLEEEGEEEDTKKNSNKKLFKLNNPKGKVVFDQQTKQRRFMSPFEQFLAEQQELFKKDEMRQNDEQNSVTLTTTASTNFDSKTVVLNSGSVHDEPISSYPKQQQ